MLNSVLILLATDSASSKGCSTMSPDVETQVDALQIHYTIAWKHIKAGNAIICDGLDDELVMQAGV